MKKAREIIDQIKVNVELAPYLNHFSLLESQDERAFKNDLGQYLNGFVDDLAIPVEILLNITSGDPDKIFAINSYRIIINDKRCRLPFPTTVPKSTPATELARSVTRAIYQNRELFLTVQLSEKIREKWIFENSAIYLKSLPVERFHEILTGLIRRGLKLDRAKGWPGKQEEKDLSTENGFPETIHNLDSIAIKVSLSKDLSNRINSSSASAKTQPPADDGSLKELIDLMRYGLFLLLGFILPKVSIDTDENLQENEFRIQLNDVRFPPIRGLDPDQFMVNDTPDRLKGIKITGKKAINPANGTQCAIVQNKGGALELCRKAGLYTWGPAGFIILNLTADVKRNSALLLTTETVEYGLDLLREGFPDLVNAAERFDIITLTHILRDLLEEDISIRDLRGILENLLAINGIIDIDKINMEQVVFFPNTANLCYVIKGKKLENLDIRDYSNYLRMSLRRYISHKYTEGSNTLDVCLMDPQMESRIRDIDDQPLTDEEHDRIIQSVFDEIKNIRAMSIFPVILTTIEIRKRLRKLIEIEFPRIAVLCYQELLPDIHIQQIARIKRIEELDQ